MPFGEYFNQANLVPAVQSGQVSQATIDDKIRRLLRPAFRFGWMTAPRAALSIPRFNQAARQVNLQSAREGLVLLKNAGDALPLNPQPRASIAIIGPDAYPAEATAGGSGHVPPFEEQSILTGLSDRLGTAVRVTYDAGLPTLPEIARMTQFTTDADSNNPGVTQETFNSADFSGAPASTETQMAMSFTPPPFNFSGFGGPRRRRRGAAPAGSPQFGALLENLQLLCPFGGRAISLRRRPAFTTSSLKHPSRFVSSLMIVR